MGLITQPMSCHLRGDLEDSLGLQVVTRLPSLLLISFPLPSKDLLMSHADLCDASHGRFVSYELRSFEIRLRGWDGLTVVCY